MAKKRGAVAFTRRWYRRVMWLRYVAIVTSVGMGLVRVGRRQWGRPRRPVPVARSSGGTARGRDARPVSRPAARSVDPVDGECPNGYPVKANTTSMIYHEPGGRSYERTRANRCYVDAASARADGFRAAKN